VHIPHQEDFVEPLGIESKLMLSGILPSGCMFGLVLFPTVPTSRDIARLFMPLSMSLKLALMPFDAGRIFAGDPQCLSDSADMHQTITRLAAQVTIMDELLAVHEDVARRRTEQLKRALGELDKSSRELKRSNEDLDQFAYVASHDLQEPLRAVTGYLDMLKRRHADKLDDEASTFVQHAVDGAKRMHALITDLLKFARVNTRGAEMTPTDCNQVLNDTIANLKIAIEESGATIERMSLPVVNGDKVQLTQLFQNLIANAIKFRGDRAPVVKVTVVSDDAGWKFSVQDNGIGFDMAHAERVFQIFKRLHTRSAYAGTGIGLAVCKKIVERHGGAIWVESVPGEGTSFYFTIPSGDN
jgi:light-regulated signal transduction histidine kinase (bacteriophytochrome)